MGLTDKPMGALAWESFFKLRTSQNRFQHVTTGQEKLGKNLSGKVKKRWVMVNKVNHA